MSNDISSLIREWKSKKEPNSLKITDTLFALGHYSTLLTQFYANMPEIMMLRSLAELGYQGYKSYLISKNHDYNSISMILSGLVNVSFNERMLDRTNRSSFGHNFYGYDIRTHPRLRSLHNELKQIHPIAEEVSLGMASPFLKKDILGEYDTDERTIIISGHGLYVPEDHFRTTALHEFAHVMDNHLNLGRYHPDVGSHDEYFSKIHHMMILKGVAHGFVTDDDLHLLQRMKNDLGNERNNRPNETIDFLHSLEEAEQNYRLLYDISSNDRLTLTQMRNYLKNLPFPLRIPQEIEMQRLLAE